VRNLSFVLENQNADGSWPYAVDGVRDFVDHFHTCFVMKALAKIHSLTGHAGCLSALQRGVGYYRANLFGADGMPRPFAKAPRVTVYRCELYDCAECITSVCCCGSDFHRSSRRCAPSSGRLRATGKADGSFRSRRLMFGWDDVPMHRWAQSQMFASLALWNRNRRRRRAASGRARHRRLESAKDDHMCGIAGEFNFARQEPVDPAALWTRTRSIAHRGPDDEGYFIDGAVGLGFRRLSIIDLSGGTSRWRTRETVWVVFNGEIYNFPELRAELEQRGHRFGRGPTPR
jgi:hypothetical protein